jgi:pimeloyl-ACP methyl ester carboxylesterase
MNKVRSADVSIHYRRLGKDRGQTPILVVHGLSYFSYDWLGVGESLGREREVILMDMRGFGDSDWSPSGDYSVPSMAQDIIAVLDHAGWTRVVLVGHSMGARSTICAAAKHPQRAAALALIDYSPENAPAGAKRTATAVAGVPDLFKTVDEAMAYFKSTDRARFEAYLKPVDGGFALKRDPFFREQFRKLLETGERPKLGVDMWQLIGEVRCPILSMRGTRSDMYAPETVAKMKAANPRLQVAEVDAGHNIAGENKDGFLSAMNQFLSQMEKAHEHARR